MEHGISVSGVWRGRVSPRHRVEEMEEGPASQPESSGPPMTLVLLSPKPVLTPQPVPPPPAPSLVPLETTDNMLELSHPLLQQTEDQFLSPILTANSPLISFSPPLDQDEYLWGMDEGEGISDLFDSYDLGDLLIN